MFAALAGLYSLCHNYLTLEQKKPWTTWNKWAWPDLALNPSLLTLTLYLNKKAALVFLSIYFVACCSIIELYVNQKGFCMGHYKSALFADIFILGRNNVCPFIKRSRTEYSTVYLGNAFQCFHNLYSQENFLTSKLNPFCCSFSVLMFRAL